MSGKSTGNPDKDAVTWFEPEYDALNMNIDASGPEALKSLYTLGIGLGMRESSGKHCTGWDTTVTDQKAETAEAGLFQTSQNSMSASAELKKIYEEYKAGNAKCHLGVFSKNVTCKEQSIVGTGKGAEFQELLKGCPSLAAEYAMITLRIMRKHYGPINRKEAEIRSECRNMLDDVQEYVERNPSSVCSDI